MIQEGATVCKSHKCRTRVRCRDGGRAGATVIEILDRWTEARSRPGSSVKPHSGSHPASRWLTCSVSLCPRRHTAERAADFPARWLILTYHGTSALRNLAGLQDADVLADGCSTVSLV